MPILLPVVLLPCPRPVLPPTQGVVQHATINNLAFGRSVDETLRTLQALQYVQANPDEVCPAGWQPGEEPRGRAGRPACGGYS